MKNKLNLYISNFISKVRKNLPEPVKKPLRWIYHKFNMKFDNEMLGYLTEYYNLREKDIRRLLKIAGRLNADFWYCTNPKTKLEVEKFYEDTPFYVLNLVFWHSTKYQRDLRAKFLKLVKGRVLDYGGGAGDLSLDIAKKGLSVDYADLQGKTFDFASWLFSRTNYKIGMINLSKEQLSKKYNTIFCIDVVEHVNDPKILLKNLVDHLEYNGYLVITALHPEISDQTPMHFEIDFDPEKYLSSLEMVKTEEEFLWQKKKK